MARWLPPLALAGAFHLLFRLNDAWRSPAVKILTFAGLAGLAVALHRRPRPSGAPPALEARIFAGAALLLLGVGSVLHGPEFAKPPQVDIGWTTRDAVRIVFLEQENPYERTTLNPHGTEPRFRGYHYGPGMFVGYWPAAVWADAGVKIANAFYLLLLLVALWWVADPDRLGPTERWAAAGFAAALVLSLERVVWFELFTQGITDLFPVALLVLALGCVGRDRWAAAGALVGLSFAAKVAPACFFLLLFLRRTTPPRFFLGAALGALPLLPFLVSNARALGSNTLVWHATKAFNDTSLLSITPAAIHWVFPILLVLAAVAMVAANLRRRIEVRPLALQLLLLMGAAQFSSRELHRNHIFWFVPVAALILAWNRGGGFPNPVTAGAGGRLHPNDSKGST